MNEITLAHIPVPDEVVKQVAQAMKLGHRCRIEAELTPSAYSGAYLRIEVRAALEVDERVQLDCGICGATLELPRFTAEAYGECPRCESGSQLIISPIEEATDAR